MSNRTSLKSDIADVVAYIDATEAIDPSKARAALARRIDNEDQFGEMRLAILARFVHLSMLKRDKNYAAERAMLCVNKGLAGVDAKVPDDKKRTQAEEIAYSTARSNFRHLLGRLGVKSKDAMQGNKNAQRPPKGQETKDAPVVLSALAIPRATSTADLDTVFGMLAAWTSRLVDANSAHFVGDKGAIYRDLCHHIVAETKRARDIEDDKTPPAPRTSRGS